MTSLVAQVEHRALADGGLLATCAHPVSRPRVRQRRGRFEDKGWAAHDGVVLEQPGR